MKVKYIKYQKGVCFGNIIFDHFYPRNSGQWRIKHPCAGNPKPLVFSRSEQPFSDDPLGIFRKLGYLASCFPEGDGISFEPPEGWTDESVINDIKECFGFDVGVM